MNYRYNFYKKAKIHLCCEYNDLRPVFGFIKFEDGKAIATNDLLILIADIKEISNLEDDDINKLNGHLISSFMYNEILRYDEIKVTDKGIECVGNKSRYDEIHAFYKFDKSESSYNFPNYKEAILKSTTHNLPKDEFYVAIKKSTFDKALDAVGASYIDLKFTSSNGAIHFKFCDMPNTEGVIKPSTLGSIWKEHIID